MTSFVEVATGIAREAGNLLRYYFERRVSFEMKGEFDLVTEADRASEKLVVERLKQHFPEHGIVAEEGGVHETWTRSMAPRTSRTDIRYGMSRWPLRRPVS
jgi:fructose-1,6-bisphosphatase/inositol monophosphatase family enzyme